MKSEIIRKLESHITAECSAVDREGLFNDMLDEAYSFESIGGPFAYMSPSRVLLEMDPTAHRCGVNDYCNGLDLVEIDGESYQGKDADEAKDSFIEDLESEVSDLESEIEDRESDDDDNTRELSEMKRRLAEMQADLKEVEKHSF